MPRTISLLPSSVPKVTHDPTVTLQGDPLSMLTDPFSILDPAIIFANVNVLLGYIDDATGLDLLGLVTPLESLLGTSTGLLSGLLGFLTPGGSTAGGGVFGPLLSLIPGLGGGAGTLGGLGSFLNPVSFIGSAAGIFGPLLSGGSLLGGLIPGLDASKIVSGTFGAGPLQPFIDAVSTGFGGSTGLGIPGLSSFLSTLSLVGVAFDDIIALIPGISGGLSGSTGLGSIFTDLTHILGSPTALGSGTPVLPGIGSIPLLGGLLSGGNILGSIIPGLDASKIISGVFGTGFIPGLDISKITSGLLSSGTILTSLIPGLDASKITSGLFGAGLIPGLDVSKIVSGVFGLGFIPGLPASQVTSGIFGAGLIPGLDASKITSGLFGAGLIPGLDVSKIISGVFGTGFIPSLPASQITSGIFGAGLIPGLDASKIVSGTIAEVTTGLGSLRDSFVNGLFGISTGSAYTNTDAQTQAATVAAQAANAQASAAAANATLAAQQAELNAGSGFFKSIIPSGANAAALSATDFASTGPTSGDLCIRGSNGYIGIKSGNATNTVGYYAILNYAFTSDDQSVTVTFGDQGDYSSANTVIYTHADTAHTVGAYCRINKGGIDIGSYTRSGSVYTYTPFTGGGVSYSGTINQGDRVEFRNQGTTWSVGINGRAASITKVDATVTFSAARRSAAVSCDRIHTTGFFGWGAGDYDSFRIAAISMADYVPTTVVGSGFRAYRATTGTANIGGTGNGTVAPNNCFDTVEQISPDLTFSLTTGTVTIGKTGWYVFSIGLKLNTALTSNANFIPCLYKGSGPTLKQYGSGAVNGTGAPAQGQAGAMIEYCAAGDTFRCGAISSVGAIAIAGDANGAKLYFGCARVGS